MSMHIAASRHACAHSSYIASLAHSTIYIEAILAKHVLDGRSGCAAGGCLPRVGMAICHVFGGCVAIVSTAPELICSQKGVSNNTDSSFWHKCLSRYGELRRTRTMWLLWRAAVPNGSGWAGDLRF